MAHTLTTTDLAHLEATSRALLSPLAFDTEDDWCRAVMQAFRPVLGSEGTSFARPDRPGGFFLGTDVDEAIIQRMNHYLAPPNQHGVGPDPVVNLFFERVIPSQITMWDWGTIEWLTDGKIQQSEFYQEVLVPGNLTRHCALFDVRPAGGVHLVAHNAPAHRRLDPEDAKVRLQLLVPAFKAGLDTLDRLKAHRATLDATDEPLAAFSPDGVETHRTPALRCLLAGDPEMGRVEQGLAELARRIRPLGFARRGEIAPGVPVTAEVRTARARYCLRAALLPVSGSGFGEAFLVTVEADGGTPALPTADKAQVRFRLTKREAEVALLVAEGLSNDAIAERLFVSRHTVRHHVEGAMAKMELTGRGREAVAARLLGSDLVAAA